MPCADQQLAAHPRVLGQDQIGGLENVQRAQGDVPQIADRRGHQIETRRHRLGPG